LKKVVTFPISVALPVPPPGTYAKVVKFVPPTVIGADAVGEKRYHVLVLAVKLICRFLSFLQDEAIAATKRSENNNC
jgi:hypothetical protein